MFDADERLMAARARLAYAQRELARFWRGSDGIDDGRTAAKLERDVELARDGIRCREAKRGGGV